MKTKPTGPSPTLLKLSQNYRLFYFALIVAMFLALRLGIILTAVEYISHYDELDLGTLAREILQGLKMPFRAYQLDAYSGESLVLGPMVIPFFKLFGQNLFAIKMVPLLFSFATLLLLFLFVRRHFNPPAALIVSLLYTLGPPMLTQLSLVGMSGHCEAAFLSLAILFSFYEFLYSPQRRVSAVILFGGLAGFGLWFYYATAIMTAVCLASWMILDRRSFLSRHLLLFLLASAIGFSPWWVINLQNSFKGIQLLAENFGSFYSWNQILLFLRKDMAFLVWGIPTSFCSIPAFFIHEKLWSYSYFFVFTFLTGSFIYQKTAYFFTNRPDKKALPLILYPFVFVLVLMSCFFNVVRDIGFVGYRYMTPFYLVLLILSALAIQEKRHWRLMSALLILGLLGHYPLLFKEPFTRALQYRGYSYYQLGSRWRMSLPGTGFSSYTDFRQMTLKFKEEERRFLLWGMVDMAILDHDPVLIEESPMRVEQIAKIEPPPLDTFVYEWLGASKDFTPEITADFLRQAAFPEKKEAAFCKGWAGNWQQSDRLMKCPRCTDDLPESCLRQAYWLGFFYPDWGNPEWPGFLQAIQKLPAEKKIWFYRSIGHAFFLQERFSQIDLWRKYRRLFSEIPPENRASVYEGMGWGIRERFREDQTRAMDWIRRLPEPAQARALSGFQAFDLWYGIDSPGEK